MSRSLSRRSLLGLLGGAAGWLMARPTAQAAKAVVKNALVRTGAPPDYDPFQHKWLMCFDIDRCIGCGLCVDACKNENHVPEASTYFRTWIERYIIKKPKPGSGQARGEVIVDSPNGGRDGFPPSLVPREEILKSFFVPKLCNLCEHSPCVQVCPVGATFDTPDGAVLVDPHYCIGCGFCIQACPYGCRFLNPVTHTAEKCTLCYHRISRGLKPACVEICPTQARIFGDLKHPVENDPVQEFIRKNKVQTLKPHLGTDPRVCYANMDKEVR
ncbi:MAG TPA: 4Fe-4S dicluster domain-containing protein [Lacunisphaera sp.]|nr:4Fe-4S dicluster domain-containing protein [Lacunisphaera sp.]